MMKRLMRLGLLHQLFPHMRNCKVLFRAFLHGKKEVHYDTSACFVVYKHKTKYLKGTLTRFTLLL